MSECARIGSSGLRECVRVGVQGGCGAGGPCASMCPPQHRSTSANKPSPAPTCAKSPSNVTRMVASLRAGEWQGQPGLVGGSGLRGCSPAQGTRGGLAASWRKQARPAGCCHRPTASRMPVALNHQNTHDCIQPHPARPPEVLEPRRHLCGGGLRHPHQQALSQRVSGRE